MVCSIISDCRFMSGTVRPAGYTTDDLNSTLSFSLPMWGMSSCSVAEGDFAAGSSGNANSPCAYALQEFIAQRDNVPAGRELSKRVWASTNRTIRSLIFIFGGCNAYCKLRGEVMGIEQTENL